MLNSIYLRRKQKLIIKKGDELLNLQLVASFLRNIEALGYTFSAELIEQFRQLPLKKLDAFHKEVTGTLLQLLGDNVEHKAMYPNFPKQVMEMPEAELYLRAILHYHFKTLPKFEKEERPVLKDAIELKIIEAGTDEDFRSIFTMLVAANASISAEDKEDLSWMIKNYREGIYKMLPETIPYKENLAFVTAELIKETEDPIPYLKSYYKGATDVLRLAVALSDGDVSLKNACKFKSFKRKERRLLLSLFEQCYSLEEDFYKLKEAYLRLGERLHPGEYEKKYPKTAKAYSILRAVRRFKGFDSKVEQALAQYDFEGACKLLSKRPGVFARRLDHLLRSSSSQEAIIEQFGAVVSSISTPVLLQVWKHYKHRNEDRLRVFFPKGNVSKLMAIENELPKLGVETCEGIMDMCREALVERFAQLPPLGKVYLDDDMANYLVPFSQRSASKALKTVVRGSRLPIPFGNTIRFFLWWKEEKDSGPVDIDLSASVYTEEWEYLDHVSYTNLFSTVVSGVHSGDITSAPNGASEFIDFNLDFCKKAGGRYILMQVYSYSEQPFCELPECFAGWMMRQFPGSGEIYAPSTVQNKIDLSADSKICLPAIFDIHTRELIWADLALSNSHKFYNNYEMNFKACSTMAKAIESLKKINLHELFSMHIEARGELIENYEEADTLFARDLGTTPFDIEKIMSEFLS